MCRCKRTVYYMVLMEGTHPYFSGPDMLSNDYGYQAVRGENFTQSASSEVLDSDLATPSLLF